nr:M15 family metallopeptidase [Brevibacterium aurantiacum]
MRISSAFGRPVRGILHSTTSYTNLRRRTLAVDCGGGINKFGSPQHKWMQKNAKKFGWEHPPWAREGQKNQEAWHWEYYGKNKETEA